ncbi:hypothetical protein EOS_38595 [Caballeronia mineralivorans PML1(12)]|uniref:Uncharacterized protein n=1 Tax=Caballeronia mineralivorans PML1(12) TaxID=908627 RepID=A0A0J1CJW5_9BURK|nr:hypothetical protein [Caballeronia mineralivorans]KLU21000.1 hypothetical protein EOS_38595 [Caballeronia mineralivorans PML1(12)]
MWLFAFFQAETPLGRILKTGVCGAAIVAFYNGLASTPQSNAQIGLSLAVIVALWLHGFRESRRLSYASALCDAEIREEEGRIRVAGGGLDLVLHLPSRTLTVNKVARRFVSPDAPGEFQRLRSGRFEWPFGALAVEPELTAANARAASKRWTGEAVTIPSGTADTAAREAASANETPIGEREIDVYWMHPGQGDRLLFSVAGPAGKYEAMERAFSIFAAWTDREDDARRAIERRHKAEAWQRDWEAKRLAEELEQTRRRGDGATDETPPHLLATARTMTRSRRW